MLTNATESSIVDIKGEKRKVEIDVDITTTCIKVKIINSLKDEIDTESIYELLLNLQLINDASDWILAEAKDNDGLMLEPGQGPMAIVILRKQKFNDLGLWKSNNRIPKN